MISPRTAVLLAAAALTFALFAGCARQAPDVTLAGTVTDAASGMPIQGAIVSDDGYGPKPFKAAITDATGKYSYMTWAEEHNIIARAPGYKPQGQTLTSGRKEKENNLDFKLTRE